MDVCLLHANSVCLTFLSFSSELKRLPAFRLFNISGNVCFLYDVLYFIVSTLLMWKQLQIYISACSNTWSISSVYVRMLKIQSYLCTLTSADVILCIFEPYYVLEWSGLLEMKIWFPLTLSCILVLTWSSQCFVIWAVLRTSSIYYVKLWKV